MDSNQAALRPGLIQRMAEPPKKVAVLRAGRIGDFLHTYPALRALRKSLPDAEITLITLPMLAELADRCPYIDRMLTFPGFPGIAEQLFDPGAAAEFFRQAQNKAFDLAIQMQGSGVNSNPFVLMLGARHTAGFIREGDPPGLLDVALPWPFTGSETERMLAMTRFLGAELIDDRLEFPLWPADHHAADDLLSDVPQPWIGLHTMARDRTRRWPLDRFAETAFRLQSMLGGTVVLLGEGSERTIVDNAFRNAGVEFTNLSGVTTLPLTGAVIARLAMFVTNDTGPAHIAYALNAPTVTIFGGGDLERYGPPAGSPAVVLAHPVACRPCGLDECPIDNYCLAQVSVDEVVSAALSLARIRQDTVPGGIHA